MNQLTRKVVTWILLLASFILFCGGVIKFNMTSETGEDFLEDVIEDVNDAAEEELLDEDSDLKEVVGEALDLIEEVDADDLADRLSFYEDDFNDPEGFIAGIKHFLKDIKDGQLGYLELARDMEFVAKYHDAFYIDGDEYEFVLGFIKALKIIVWIAAGLVLLAILLSAFGKGFGIVLYMIYNILTLLVSWFLIISAVNSSEPVAEVALPRFLTTAVSIAALAFWIATRKSAMEKDQEIVNG